MSATDFGVQLIHPLAIFRGEPGDRLIVRVGHPDPIMLIRRLPPNYGAIITALDLGYVLPLNPHRAAAELITTLTELQAAPPPPPRRDGRASRGRWPGYLHLMPGRVGSPAEPGP